MQWVPSPYKPGFIGFPGTELARFAEFHDSHEGLMVPYGSIGRPFRSYDAAWNYNDICNAAMVEGSAWVWILNDDNVFAPDLLLKLLQREADIITPLVAFKNSPFPPMVYHDTNDQGMPHVERWNKVQVEGLDTTLRSGCNGLLIQRHVLEKIEPPWFRPGIVDPSKSGEDIYFTQKVVEAGFTIQVDCDNRIGHITIGTVWPMPPHGVEIEFGGLHGLRQMVILEEGQ